MKSSPPELGKIEWIRDYEVALETSKKSKKPIMCLFQEIPGCSTCTNFGKAVLSDPKVMEISKDFICLAIYNNKAGKDREILEKYGEPSWNNPVVRFLDSNGKDLIKRKSGVYNKEEIMERMKVSLEEFNKI